MTQDYYIILITERSNLRFIYHIFYWILLIVFYNLSLLIRASNSSQSCASALCVPFGSYVRFRSLVPSRDGSLSSPGTTTPGARIPHPTPDSSVRCHGQSGRTGDRARMSFPGQQAVIRWRLGRPKSGHRMAAEGMQFSWRWNGGTTSLNLGVIWGMSDQAVAAMDAENAT